MASNGVLYSGGTGGTGLNLTSGDVTRINISTNGVVKFNDSYSFPTADGSANQVLITNGSGSVSFDTIPNASLDNSSITINGSSVSLGGSINVGTVTSVGITAGALIDVSNSPITSSGNITVAVDLSELTTSTTNGDGDYFVVVDTANNQRKLTKANINLSGFNNDAGFTTNTGTVTSVAIAGTDGIDVDSGSPITGSGTITLGLSSVPNSSLANSSVEVVGGSGLTGGGTVSLGGSVTLNVGAGTLIDVDGSNVNVDLSELTTSTSNGDGDFFVVVDSANAQKKLTKGNINISGFNNDAGYITSAGNTNIYNTNGTISSTRTVSQITNSDLIFQSQTGEKVFFVSNVPGATTPVRVPKVRIAADDPFDTGLEIQTLNGSNIISGYEPGGGLIFDVDGGGNLFATSKSFLIEHPSKPEFSLRHGSLEGPEHGVYVRGKLDGSNTIELPEYWVDLVDESSITVQLTPIGSHQNLYVKDIVDNKIIVSNSALLSSKVKCFYFVQAERKDIDKMVVEFPKGTSQI